MADETVKVVVEGKLAVPPVSTPTKEFKLRAGKQHSHDGVAMREGDTVHLTEGQASAFKDKVEPVDPAAAFTVHSHEDVEKTRKANAARNVTPAHSGESAQAQADKAAAELKASAGYQSAGDVTAKGAEGTLTKDPIPETTAPEPAPVAKKK